MIVDGEELSQKEQVRRFVGGAAAGLVLAIIATVALGLKNQLLITLVFVGLIVGCGLASLFYGKRFWDELGNVDELD